MELLLDASLSVLDAAASAPASAPDWFSAASFGLQAERVRTPILPPHPTPSPLGPHRVPSQVVRLEHSRGLDAIGVALALLHSTLTAGLLLTRWRAGEGALDAAPCCAHAALLLLALCKLCVGAAGGFMEGTAKMLVEYCFFLFLLSAGLLADDWWAGWVAAAVPPLRCLAALAQTLCTRSLRAGGALSCPAVALELAAAAIRYLQAGDGGADSSALFGEWPMNTLMCRVTLLGQALYYWGAAPPPPPKPRGEAAEEGFHRARAAAKKTR